MRNYFKDYLKNRPIFIALIRGKEAELFQGALPLSGPILDYGCGDGFFARTAMLGKQGKIDVGLDVEKKVLPDANNSGAYKKTICVKDSKFPFKNGYFGSVVSNCVLEHVESLEKDLEEIHRVLRPGGTFVCTVMTDKWEGYLFGRYFFGNYYKTWMRKKQAHVQLPSVLGWEKYFKNAGFKIKKKVGYLDRDASKWLDILHYLSFYSLVNKLLFGKWVVFPLVANGTGVGDWMRKKTSKKVALSKSAAAFFVLTKK